MQIDSRSAQARRARWSTPRRRLAAILTAAAAAAAVASGLTAPARAEPEARGTSSPIAAADRSSGAIRLAGSLWLDCRGNGRRSAQDPPVRDAVVELVTTSGQLSTTLTGRAGTYAFTLRGGLPEAVVVPLIQTALDGLVPSPPSGSQPLPGRSLGTRVADLDRLAVSATEARSSASRYDFGFVGSGGRARVRAACSGASRTTRGPAARS